jgi:hypothetical protein
MFFKWSGTKPTRYCGQFWPIVQAPDDRWGWLWSNRWNEDWQGKPKYSEKTCPSATLSTTNPTWPDSGSDPGSNPGRSCGKPATNRLSYGAALKCFDKNPEGKRDKMEDLVYEREILNGYWRNQMGRCGLHCLVLLRDQWRALASTMLKFQAS